MLSLLHGRHSSEDLISSWSDSSCFRDTWWIAVETAWNPPTYILFSLIVSGAYPIRQHTCRTTHNMGGSCKWKKNKWVKREKKPRSRLCKAKKNGQKTDDKLAEESVGVNERKKIKQISVFLSAGSLFCYLSGLLLFFGSVLCCVVKRKWKLKEPRSTQKKATSHHLFTMFFLSLLVLPYLSFTCAVVASLGTFRRCTS